MVSELVKEFAAQRCRGTRDPHGQRCGIGPVFGPGVQFPGCLEGNGRKAFMASGYRGQKVIPGLIGESPQIIRDTVGVEQLRGRGGAGRGPDCDSKQERCEGSVHETRIQLSCPFLGGDNG